MAWEKNYSLHGKHFRLFGWGRDVSLQLSVEDAKAAGDELENILDWFVENAKEIGLVELWKESRYDKQMFDSPELAVILNSQFASAEDREAVFEHPKPVVRAHPKEARVYAGFVYLIRSEYGQYKIGKTKRLDQRMRAFGVTLPFKIESVHTIPCDNVSAAEKELHERYADKRLEGEWFALTAEDVVAIKAIESM